MSFLCYITNDIEITDNKNYTKTRYWMTVIVAREEEEANFA